ncbi:hypothetical protein RD792_002404 [Penstemon davidsonii]|uniref:Uncharacterized protein n=1 Tax=Penstemon davidsonii TaxID=160366 RepID=A0ABR0DQY4_9LAMI|nr:hypothetical protein RD792_002404 [Penstemon davidsonii]
MMFKLDSFASSACCFLLLYFASLEKLVGVKAQNSSVSTILLFGDSTVDTGNNNYIKTLFRSNFSPYGRDFVNHTATGRFCDGKILDDFIAEYLGIKEYVPPYLDPTLSIEELMSGVSFGSAGTGFDPITPRTSNVLSLPQQLENFKEYQAKLQAKIGNEKTKELINNTLFIVSAGTDDFLANYYVLPIRRLNYTISSYMNFVLQQARQVYQELLDQGARRIGVVGLPPIGCLPIAITVFSGITNPQRNCLEKYSSVARDYNQLLQNELTAMKLASGANIGYIDVYGPLEDLTLRHKYGLTEVSVLCNPLSIVCRDVNEYVFWDAIHPIEKAYDLIFQSFRPAIDALVTN